MGGARNVPVRVNHPTLVFMVIMPEHRAADNSSEEDSIGANRTRQTSDFLPIPIAQPGSTKGLRGKVRLVIYHRVP